MSEKKTDIPEEFPEAQHGEIGDVTITEYRKNQIVRLAECFIVSPICIYTGIRYRKEIPKWLSTSLVVFGTATLIYNGRNFIVNWNRDGKLIRQAIKQKKEEEKKVRDKIIKVENNVHKAPDKKPQEKSVVVSEKKVNIEDKTVKYSPDKKPETEKNGHSKKENEIIETTEATLVKTDYKNNLKQVVVSDVKTEQQVTTATIIEEKKENIDTVSDKKKEVEAVEKPVVSEELKDNSANNGKVI